MIRLTDFALPSIWIPLRRKHLNIVDYYLYGGNSKWYNFYFYFVWLQCS